VFTPEAVRRIAAYSRGIPRLINTICDNALFVAWGTTQPVVSVAVVEEAARDLLLVKPNRFSGLPPAFRTLAQRTPTPLVWGGVGVLLLALVLGGGRTIFSPQTERPVADHDLNVSLAPADLGRDEPDGEETAPPAAESVPPASQGSEQAEPAAVPSVLTAALQQENELGGGESPPPAAESVPPASVPPASQGGEQGELEAAPPC